MSLLRWLGVPPPHTPNVPPPAPPSNVPPPPSDPNDFGGYRIVERSDGRFNVNDCRGSITTRKSREQAKEYILELLRDGKPRRAASAPPSRSRALC